MIYQLTLVIGCFGIGCRDIQRQNIKQDQPYKGEPNRVAYEREENSRVEMGINNQFPPFCEESIRISSFNIHYFKDIQETGSSLSRILEDIKTINATVVIMNEFPTIAFNPESKIAVEEMEKSLGYLYSGFGIDEKDGSVMGNYLFSKRPISQFQTFPLGHNRTLVHALIDNYHIYGTHLDIKSSQIRVMQARKIVEIIGETKNVVLTGDFNGLEDSTEVGIISNRLSDSFKVLQWDKPFYTCWAGTRIDFNFVSGDILQHVLGSYTFHTTSSDHLPIVIDLSRKEARVQKQSQADCTMNMVGIAMFCGALCATMLTCLYHFVSKQRTKHHPLSFP